MDNPRVDLRLYRQHDSEQGWREGILIDILLGVVGAVVGGWIFTSVGHSSVTGFNIYSILVSVIGALIVLFVYHAIQRVIPRRGSM